MNQYVTGAMMMIKKLREARKLSQSGLAEKLSVSDKAVSKWETGRGYPYCNRHGFFRSARQNIAGTFRKRKVSGTSSIFHCFAMIARPSGLFRVTLGPPRVTAYASASFAQSSKSFMVAS